MIIIKDLTRTAKILIDFSQVTGSITELYSVEIPIELTNFLKHLDIVQIDFVVLAGLPCFGD